MLVIDALYVLLGAALAVAVAWPIYQDPRAWLVGGVGVAVGLLAAIGGRLLRLPWWADLLVAAALYLLVAVPVAIPSAFPDRWFSGLRDAATGVVTGWKDIVTLDPPLGTYQAVLVPLLVVVLFGSYAAARVAVTARRAHLVAAVVLVAMLAFGVVFGVGKAGLAEPYAPGWLPVLPWIGILTVYHVAVLAGVLLVVLSLAWLAARARRERAEALARAAGIAQARVAAQRGSGWALARRGGVAIAMVGIAVAVAGFVAVPAAGADRDVVRDHVRPVEFSAEQASPLAGYREWMSDDEYDAELFTVTAPDSVDRLRLAVLDAYDGTRFAISSLATGSRFVRTPTHPTTAGVPVDVTIGPAYTAPWVPLPGDVGGPATFPGGGDRGVELGDALYYATDDSLAIVIADHGDGTNGFEPGDEVVAIGEPQADARARIAALEASGSPINGVDQAAYPELSAWVAAQGVGGGGAGLLELVDRLRERGYASHGYSSDEASDSLWEKDLLARDGAYEFKPSRAGHSAQRIEDLFAELNERQRQAGASTDPADLVAAVGDDEQFAAAAALIAWSQGIPARVVVGVRLRDEAGGPAIQPAILPCAASGGSYTCRGRNVGAWIEVNVGGVWVPLDTSPQFALVPRLSDEGENPPEHGTLPERPASNVIDPPGAARNEVESQAAEQGDAGTGLSLAALAALRVAAVVAAAAALVVVPPGIIVAAKSLRRSRRRAREPEVAIVGAWEELVDECVDLGLLPAAAGGTRSQIAERLGDPVARQLAAVADRAVFGATSPEEADSALAWEMVREEQRRLRQELPFRRRLGAALAPRSFVRHLRPTSARVTLAAGKR